MILVDKVSRIVMSTGLEAIFIKPDGPLNQAL